MYGFVKKALIGFVPASLIMLPWISYAAPQDKTQIENIVHQYLVKNPEVLVEAMQVLQKRQFEQAEKAVKDSAAKNSNALFREGKDPVIGDANGAITVVEFFDYQCPHCVDMAPVIDGIVKANPNIRVVFKEFPIRGPVSDFAARAALAANKQNKYYPFSHALLKSNKALTQESILEIAKTSGLDVDKLKADMADKGVVEQVKNNIKLAQDLKLMGTPALFVGKTNNSNVQYLPGRVDQAQLQKTIDTFKN